MGGLGATKLILLKICGTLYFLPCHRLWEDQNLSSTEVCSTLNMGLEVYGWFTEGFDTADLQDAKALLQELAAPQR